MKSKRKKLILILCLVFLLGVVQANFVHARGLVPCGGTGEAPCKLDDVFVLIARVTNFLLGFAGVFATFAIIRAGFWLVAAGGDEEAITKNKNALTQAVIGLVLSLMAFMFVNTAVNFLLHSKCKLDLTNPLNYLKIDDQCRPTGQ